MIGPGWLPARPRPLGLVRRRTLPYTDRRRRAAARRSDGARRLRSVNNEDMIFDRPPAELPVATLRPREPGTRIAVAVRHWFARRWSWLRPRTVPVAVAFVGMLAVLGSANYLRSFANQTPEQLSVSLIRQQLAITAQRLHDNLEALRPRVAEMEHRAGCLTHGGVAPASFDE